MAFKIRYHEPYFDDREARAAAAVINKGCVGAAGEELARASATLATRLQASHVLVTNSCTSALETAMIVLGVAPGDEVIVPAFTFTSTANCVVRQGARVVFADIREDDLNIDHEDVASRITPRTRAIIPVHYGGVACDMDALAGVTAGRAIAIVEDAAHAFDSRYRGRLCGTLGDAACLSFHVSKNVTCGEGGALILKDPGLARRAEFVCDMGTDRAQVFRGEATRYVWRDVGSSFRPSEALMAILNVQLEKASEITARRKKLYQRYQGALGSLASEGIIAIPRLSAHVEPNGHIFFILLRDASSRERCERRLRDSGIEVTRHYHALDTSPFGSRFATSGQAALPRTKSVTERLLRLPLHARLAEADQDRVIEALHAAVKA
jgi:dTDP-4-amino-4,6-dideoxygalactose transaminase